MDLDWFTKLKTSLSIKVKKEKEYKPNLKKDISRINKEIP